MPIFKIINEVGRWGYTLPFRHQCLLEYFDQHCTNFLSSKIFILRFALSLEGNTYKVLSFWFAIMHAYVFKTVIHVYIVCVCVRVQQTLGSIKLIYTVMFCVLNKVCVSMYIVIICEIAQCFLIKGI